jgi:hypothetical protein
MPAGKMIAALITIACLTNSSASAEWQWTATDKSMFEYIQDGYTIAASTLTFTPSGSGPITAKIRLSGNFNMNDVPRDYTGTITSDSPSGQDGGWWQTYVLQKGTSVVRCFESHNGNNVENSCVSLIKPPK